MTIAACYLSSEGIVLGADSTSSVFVANPNGVDGQLHQLNYAQKVFEIGEDSTVGVAIWGMGSIGDLSHRTFIAQCADDLAGSYCSDVRAIAERFSDRFWREYQPRFQQYLDRYAVLEQQAARTPAEDGEIAWLRQTFSGGFCLGGHTTASRAPQAFQFIYGPGIPQPPAPGALAPGSASFWGCPNIIERVLYSWDQQLFLAVLQSGKWTGTQQELFDIIAAHRIAQPLDLPLREAIDWVHTVIYTTIKALKFSHYVPTCGGPIEIAVISSDRRFRWVRHKRFDEALE
jgi:hypothetical protein